MRHIDSHLTIGANVSWKLILCCSSKPRATIRALKRAGPPSTPGLNLKIQHAEIGRILGEGGTRSQVWFSNIELYSDAIASAQRGSSLASAYVIGSPPSSTIPIKFSK
uniref:Uncharacterized protein n=1 Tax=Physcomitrium patens TaxID=3218 RepID=A0A2K1J1K9_PHYPA|nr:hypothetical protein PHYPA_023313 [Physcomitrium patens]